MGKAGFMTPKAIGNRIKAKGLQKLRWYCQCCAKQCRDENGFKCHTESENHQRQLLLVAENPEEFVDKFSQDFEEAFLDQLKRTKGSKRVSANHIYNEFIADKEHVHMNATKWRTLTEFVHHLGQTGHCIVDETPKGYYVQFIDKDPEVIARQKELERRGKADLDESDRQNKVINEMIAKDKEKRALRGEVVDEVAPTALVRDEHTAAVKISFSKSATVATADAGGSGASFKDILKAKAAEAAASGRGVVSKAGDGGGNKRKKSSLEMIKEQEEERKRKKLESEQSAAAARKDYWLKEGVIVKVMNKKLSGGKYFKAKGVVTEVVQKYGAKVRLHDSKAVLTLDQEDLETVIPKPGAAVLVVNGQYRGLEATLISLETDKFSCTVELQQGALKGRRAGGIAYEDICKLQV